MVSSHPRLPPFDPCDQLLSTSGCCSYPLPGQMTEISCGRRRNLMQVRIGVWSALVATGEEWPHEIN